MVGVNVLPFSCFDTEAQSMTQNGKKVEFIVSVSYAAGHSHGNLSDFGIL